jgi:hypothetical protein
MNGAKHDVEDILASIRTSIADRSPGFDGERREPRITALRGRASVADEAVDFELPAIFKEPVRPMNERPNLLGRLSEVLGSGGHQSEWDRSRTVIPFEPAHGRMIEPPPVALDAEIARNGRSVAVEKLAAENDSVKRIMPTFFDTRLNRMGEMSRPVETPSAPEQQAEPPRLPEAPQADAANGAIEDAAAQLLRPILKQWLTENMPKIVEKALRSDEPGGPRRH